MYMLLRTVNGSPMKRHICIRLGFDACVNLNIQVFGIFPVEMLNALSVKLLNFVGFKAPISVIAF